MFPLQSALLPGEMLPLRIFEPRYTRLVQDCLAAEVPEFGVVLISRGSEVGGDDARNTVGALARITHHMDLGDGQYELLAQIGERLRVRSWLPEAPYPRAMVELWPDERGGEESPVTDDRTGQVVDAIFALYQRMARARGAQVR
ncbi:MAG: LON peptidase substrate-binding domain-containing protein, partial [Mycobacterium sp.]|nr:LON peptidase substrate-binding domain-containing protein [Mycobacterium sp.]